MKKKFSISMLTVITAMVMLFSCVANAARPIKVLVGGEKIESDVAPIIVEDRTMLPVRAVFEAIGAKVDYVAEEQKVIATKGDITVEFVINSNVMKINGEEKELDADIILVTYLAKDGLSVASDHEIIVSLDLTITDELKKEGLAREMIRSIQDARKQIGCEIMDNITISLKGDYPTEWVEAICAETLSSVGKIDTPDTVINIDDVIEISVKK
jgi:hypothetical protein